MAPVELTNWLNHYLNEMSRIVIKYGGTLDKYIGDAVMIFFGDPTSRGLIEDAIPCVKMAQEMIFRTKIMGLDIRIGISTGECTVGNFGSFDRMDYTIIGKEVNVASRLEGLGAPGSILISESTYQLVKDEVASRGAFHIRLTCSAGNGYSIDGSRYFILTGSMPAISLYSNGANWFVF